MALVGCAEGARHVLGARGVRLVLERRAWQVRFIGADVPVDEWARLQEASGARLLCISFSSLRTRADVLRTLRTLEAAYDPDRPFGLALGGGIPMEETEGLASGPFLQLAAYPALSPFVEWLDGRDAA